MSTRVFRRMGAGAGLLALSAYLRSQAPPLFEEMPASATGITWVHESAMSEDHYLPESMPPGVAFFDYDNDGWMDIFLVNTGPCDYYQPKAPLKNALYKNNGNGTFTDVAEQAGVAETKSFGMGAVVGDYDNDGDQDLIVTGYGGFNFYQNNGNGTFTDITSKSGLKQIPWTTSGVFYDYNNDALPDLHLLSFCEYTKEVSCGGNKLGKKFYCVPRIFNPTHSYVYRNNGNGTFTDVTKGTAIEKALGKGMSAVATDINNDGRLDVFVSNDTVQNFLFINRADEQWDEIGLSSLVGYSANGQPRSGMGIEAADFDHDGWEDLYVANIDQEMFSLYRNRGKEVFSDVAAQHGIAQATRKLSGWGVKFFDYDIDGDVDLFQACGHPDDMVESYSMSVKWKEPPLLFHNEGGKLRNVSAEAGPIFQRQLTARGMAVGDYNNDGRIDVVIGNLGDAPILLKNNAGQGNHWVGLHLEGVRCNRDAIGARITWSAGGVVRTRQKNRGGSYLSSHDPREVLGLGPADTLDWVEIKWPLPSGRVERFTNLPLGKYTKVVEGTGKGSS